MDDFDKVLADPADPVPRPDGVPPLATDAARLAASEFAAQVMSDADALAFQRSVLARPPDGQAAPAEAVIFVPERAPWPGECTNSKYVEILRAPTTLVYELRGSPDAGGVDVKMQCSVDPVALEQVRRCVKLERSPHVAADRLPVAIDLNPDLDSNKLRMQVRVDMDILNSMRETGAFPHLPSSVFEPVAVVETVIDVDVDPLVEVKFDFEQGMESPVLKIAIDNDAEALYKNLGWYSESSELHTSREYADEVLTAPYTNPTPAGSPPVTDRRWEDRYERAQEMRENKASSTISKQLKKKKQHEKELEEKAIKIQAVQRGKKDRKLVDQKMQAKKELEEERRPMNSVPADDADEQKARMGASVGFRGLQELSDSKQREVSTDQQEAPAEDFTVVQTVQQVRRVKLPVKHKGKLVMREFVVVDHHHIHHHHHFHHDAQAQQDHKEQMRSLEYKARASVDPPAPPTSLPVGQGPNPPPPKA